jgi:hypothetical protein
MTDLSSQLMHLPLLLLLAWLVLRKLRQGHRGTGGPLRILPFLVLAALLTVGGCSSSEKLAEAKGSFFPLNPDHWQATPQDLEAPPGGARQ